MVASANKHNVDETVDMTFTSVAKDEVRHQIKRSGDRNTYRFFTDCSQCLRKNQLKLVR